MKAILFHEVRILKEGSGVFHWYAEKNDLSDPTPSGIDEVLAEAAGKEDGASEDDSGLDGLDQGKGGNDETWEEQLARIEMAVAAGE
jgi:hypothetical protein